MRKFFDTVATRLRHVYDIANRDADNWVRSVIAPMETQVRERQGQLRRRVDSVRRIHSASSDLEVRMQELSEMQKAAEDQVADLQNMVAQIDVAVSIQQTLSLSRDAA